MRFEQVSPIELLPLGTPQSLIHGAKDDVVAVKLSEDYREAASRSGDDVRAVVLGDAAHFELIAPSSSAWSAVRKEVLLRLGLDQE